MKLRMNILTKSYLGRWSVSLSATFMIVFFVSIGSFLLLGALAPNLAGSIALKLEIAALSVTGIGAFISGLISITKKRERSILIFLSVVISLMGVLLLGIVIWGSPQEVSEEEIINLILTQDTMEGHYHVFDPEMSLMLFSDKDDNIRYSFRQEGLNFDTLVTTLFANNAEPVQMNIQSSPDKGYLIDYDGKFQSYFEKDGDGWTQLRQENPEARSLVYISVPAYDPKTGFVMICLGWQGDALFGEGRVMVYKYIFGRLITISSILIWIS